MNALSKVQAASDAVKIAHSVLGYDRTTEELDVERPIPLFLDTLALKITGVPAQDKYGAVSYPIAARALDTLRFLLGLEIDVSKRDYFIEPTAGYVTGFGPGKLRAVELLTTVTPRPRYARTDRPRISERELVVPTLRLLDDVSSGWMATSDVIARLTDVFAPSGQDAEIREGHNARYFSQRVRDMIAHRHQPSSFLHNGLAHYERDGLRISDAGRSTVRALLS